MQPLWAFRQALADALGVTLPAAASAREMVSSLMKGFVQEPTALLLDGMEALAHGPGP